jgi:hypothetical protein
MINLIIIWPIPFFSKNNFWIKSINCLYFSPLKVSGLNFFSFLPYLFLSLSPFSFISLLFLVFFYLTQEQFAAPSTRTEQPNYLGPSPSCVAPLMAPPSFFACSRPHPLLLSSPFPSSPVSPMADHGAPTSAMAVPSMESFNQGCFFRGTTKTDAYDLPLAIPGLNFI